MLDTDNSASILDSSKPSAGNTGLTTAKNYNHHAGAKLSERYAHSRSPDEMSGTFDNHQKGNYRY